MSDITNFVAECFTIHLYSYNAVSSGTGTWTFNVNFESVLPKKYNMFRVETNFQSSATTSNNNVDGVIITADFPSNHNLSLMSNSRLIVLAHAIPVQSAVTSTYFIYTSNTTTNPPNCINYPNQHSLTINSYDASDGANGLTFTAISQFTLILTFYPVSHV